MNVVQETISTQTGNKRDAARDDMRTRLIDAAERRIAAQGLMGLKAREVTADAGVALGGLYNAFADLDALVLQVNSRTLHRLGAVLRAACPVAAGPKETLAALAQAYVAFALEQFQLWSALFNHRLPEGVEAPEWHRADHAVLIEEIIGPLAALRPDLDAAMVQQRAKTVFAAVHGVVQLSLRGRYVGLARKDLASEVAALVDAMSRGLSVGNQV